MLSSTQIPFNMDSDIVGLTQADYGYLEPGSDVQTYIRTEATCYGLVSDCWVLYSADLAGLKFAAALEATIRSTSLSQAIAYCNAQADNLRTGNPVDEWIADACDATNPAKVIQALSFSKRFAPSIGNSMQSDPADAFISLQKVLRSRQGDFKSTEHWSGGRPRTSFYDRLTKDIRTKIRCLIGEGPGDLTDKLGKLSPGVSLMSRFTTSKCPAEKIAHILRCDSALPNYSRSWTNVRWNWNEATWNVALDDKTCWYSDPWYAGPIRPIPESVIGEWYSPFTEVNESIVGHEYHRSQSVFVYGCGSQWQKARKVQFCAVSVNADITSVYLPPYGVQVRIYQAEEGHIIKFMSVPKAWNKKRGIGIDRPERMSDQLLVKAELEHALARTWVGRLWLNLRNQEQNQSLSRDGAAYGEFATTDISSASDWISLSIARDCFPGGWYRAFVRTRPTHFAVLSMSQPRKMYTLAPMGCGWTFHMESVFYCALAMVAYDYAEMYGLDLKVLHIPDCFKPLVRYARHRWCYKGIPVTTPGGHPYLVSVYGDDAIMPVEVARVYLGLCDVLGIEANHSKSFLEGPFRESCGGDWFRTFDGNVYNATPIYWPRSSMHCFEFDPSTGRHVFCKDQFTRTWTRGEVEQTTELSKLVDLQHRLWGVAPRACNFLTEFIMAHVPNMTVSRVGESCSDLWGPVERGVAGIFDDQGRTRPLRKGESYLTVTDPVTGETVAANARVLHLQPVTTYPSRYAVKSDNLSESEIDTLVDEYRLAQFLEYGGHYECKTTCGNEKDIPILRVVDTLALTNEPEIVWELK